MNDVHNVSWNNHGYGFYYAQHGMGCGISEAVYL